MSHHAAAPVPPAAAQQSQGSAYSSYASQPNPYPKNSLSTSHFAAQTYPQQQTTVYPHGYEAQKSTYIHQPQIAPWTQYMRSSQQTQQHQPSASASTTLLSNQIPPAPAVSNPANTAPAVVTKRHNPYAANSDSGSSAITSPALGYTAASMTPNALSFDRVPSNNNSITQNPHTGGGRSTEGPRSGGGGGGGDRNQNRQITTEDVRQQAGHLLDLAHTANGSAFLQAAIRGTNAETQECIALISAELLPHLGDLLLDSHGCYIIKTLMERMPTSQLQDVMIRQIAPDESLVYSLCTHSLHTRRVVQFLLDTVDCTFLIATITARCNEIATTQQGCIVVQRAMDVAVGPQRAKLLESILSQFNTFCFDPFANYVLQHMFSVGCSDPDVCRGVWSQIQGNVIALSCNKFASNVVEKCLSNLPTEYQHEILKEMYDVPEERLLTMLQDSFGNYIVQSSIALAPQKDIPFMRTKLMAVLDRTPYGHKIESRLERRRKIGKNDSNGLANGAHQSHTNGNAMQSHSSAQNGRQHAEKSHQGHKGRPQKTLLPVAPVAEGEEPW